MNNALDQVTETLSNVATWTPNLKLTPQYQAWQSQKSRYAEWWSWYTGQALLKEDTSVKNDDGSPSYYYPLHINPLTWIAEKHAAAVYGEVPDFSPSMCKFDFLDGKGKHTDRCDEVADLVNRIWAESNGREKQYSGTLNNQVTGGHFWRIKYDPFNPFLSTKLYLDMLLPDFVLPIYRQDNFWLLDEAWVMYYISLDEAIRLAPDIKNLNINVNKVLYAEHWTNDKVEVRVGGLVPTLKLGDMQIAMEYPNEDGFVPFVYIPHLPRTASFYGHSHVPDIIGLIEELNRRAADYGDFVKDLTERLLWIRDASTRLGNRPLNKRYGAVDLGSTGMSGKPPEMGEVAKGSTSSESHHEMVKFILNQIDRTCSMPPVAYGEDEGSQRSGMTLATRFYPLKAHIAQERAMHVEGFRMLHKMLLRMLLNRGQGGITETDLALQPHVSWYSILPLDRDQQVQEVTLRKQTGLISTHGALVELGDGSDVSEEEARIAKEKDEDMQREIEIASAQAEAKASFAPAKP